MRRLLTTAAVAALALALTAPAQAKGGKPGGHVEHGGRNGGYGNGKGLSSRKFTGQKYGSHYRFHGREGHYWSRTRWSKRYGCECRYCPTTRCWYYWYAPQTCYYPVSCYKEYPPAPVATAPVALAVATATATASASAGVAP
jgi:hypothetical protein